MRYVSIFVCWLVSSVAAAQVPAMCDTSAEAAYYAVGVRKGRNLAAQLIARATSPTEVCGDLEGIDALRALAEATIAAVHISPGASEAVRCHAAGQFAGLLARLTEVRDECEGGCIADGLFSGEIGGALYCGLSVALSGFGVAEVLVRLPTDACGVAFESSCDASFATFATGEAACVPYTQGAHAEAYAAARTNACAHHPE